MMHDHKCGCPNCYARNRDNFEPAEQKAAPTCTCSSEHTNVSCPAHGTRVTYPETVAPVDSFLDSLEAAPRLNQQEAAEYREKRQAQDAHDVEEAAPKDGPSTPEQFQADYPSLGDIPSDVLASRIVGTLILQKGNLNKYQAVLQGFIDKYRAEAAQPKAVEAMEGEHRKFALWAKHTAGLDLTVGNSAGQWYDNFYEDRATSAAAWAWQARAFQSAVGEDKR